MTYASLESRLNWRNYAHFMFHAEENFMSAKLALQLQFDMRALYLWAVFSLRHSLMPALALSSVQMLLPKSKGEHLLRGRAMKKGRDCLSAFSHVLRTPTELSKHFLFHRYQSCEAI